MRKLTTFLFAFLILNCLTFAGTVEHTVFISPPNITNGQFGARVTMPEAMTTGEVGEPELPVYGLNLLLPPGEEAVSIEMIPGNLISLGTGFYVPPVQRQYPLSFNGPLERDPENPEIYTRDSFFPADLAAKFNVNFFRGHGIVSLALNPVVYNPVTGELAYYSSLTVKVNSTPTEKGLNARTVMLKQDTRTVKQLENLIANNTAVSAYGAVQGETDEPYYDILLITHTNMVELWGDYIDWKTKCGYYVAVETVADIYTNYPGRDNQEKIRNCIIDYYDNFDLVYVFLAGDDEFIPHRGLYASSGYTDNDIAGDCYYAGLDGTWNDDNDSHWGEPNEADLLAEVYVSRAAVDSQSEIANFVNKQMMFMREPVVDEVETALMVGEDLGWPIWAWEYKEEIRTGSSSWGFNTAPFPPNFDVRTLYEVPGYSWSGLGDLAPLMNQGPIYINHLGHADVNYMMQLYDYQVTTANFTNNGVNHNFYLIYSQGCYCGSFDNRTTGGSYVDDCITEDFTVLSTGAVAMITNSRYGWGELSTTQGSSQYYDKQFFDAIWGEDLTIASEANTDSKTDCIPYIDYNQNRWCFYEINLFSEPTLDLWTAEPQILGPSYAAEIFLGASSFQVEVPGVEGARVCLSKDGVIHGLGFTNASGQCTLIMSVPIQSLGIADLFITAHDYIPHEGSVLVIPPTGPYVVYENAVVDDASGNNNGQWDYGETVDLDLTVENVGVANALNVVVNLETDDPLVIVTGSNVSFGNINQGQTATVQNAFTVEVDAEVADGHYVAFTLIASNGVDDWTSYFNLQVHAPDVVFEALDIDDSAGGNGNGCLDPGESATLEITLLNEGSCYATNLLGVLSTADPYITITQPMANYGEILAGATGVEYYDIEVSQSCPQEHPVEFLMELSDEIGYIGETDFTTIVGDVTYDPTGPDNYGYRAYDPNDAPEFPEFEWVEISADSGGPGTEVVFTLDDQVFHFALPFTFQYYGIEYDSITIAANGWLAMGIYPEDDYSNSGIPNADGPFPMIAPYWEDMSPQRANSGGVWYWYDAVNHLYIVEFNHVEQFAPTGNFETFQTILYDPAYHQTSTDDGRIKFQYKDMSTASASEGTYGIENHTETDGIQYCFDGDLDIHAMPIQDGMCVLYTTPVDMPSIAVTLTPESLPIVIPSQGGSFNYTAEVENTGTSPAYFDVWIAATLPTGSDYEILSRPGITLGPGVSIMRNMTQNVPGNAPAGDYTYNLYAGNYGSSIVWAEDSFPFEKLGVSASSPFQNWDLFGWDDETSQGPGILPEVYSLKQNYPNPFNPLTTIRYELPKDGLVKLTIFNTLGQEIAMLMNGFQTAGFKSVTFDAKGLSSGMYFYRIEAGDFKDMKKMVLLK